MAVVDYANIVDQIKTQLEADAGLAALNGGNGPSVFVESEITFASEVCPAIYIYLDRRNAPVADQRLSAGKRVDYQVRVTIWCAEWHGDSVRKASEFRDDLIGLTELALLDDRTLQSSVEYSWLEGGEFASLNDNGFLSMGEIILVCKVNGKVT